MKRNIKIACAFIFLLLTMIFFMPHSTYANTTSVASEDALTTAISGAVNGDVIKLTSNIVLTKPIEITGKTLTINGSGYTISASSSFAAAGENGTLITAGAGAKVTLSNLTLKDSPKYGVQAYNGGYIALNNVNISGCKYGGVLVNAGTVEVISLNLGRNGGDSNNGIEIAKGYSVNTGSNEPTLIMNGTLSSSEKENVVYIAINDKLSTFEVKNTDNTVDRIAVSGNKIVVSDPEGNILYQSNARDDIKIEGEVFVPKSKVTNTPQKDSTPKTGTEGVLVGALATITLSAISIAILRRKVK